MAAASSHPLRVVYRSARARPRILISLLFGLAAGFLIPANSLLTHALLGWNAGVVLFIVLALTMMTRTGASDIRHRAIAEEEGRFTVLALMVAAAIMVLVAIGLEIFAARQLQGMPRALSLALTFLTVIASWGFVHVVFTIYYAHEYHAEIKGRGKGQRRGLDFPGENMPDYTEFLYFAFTVGMTAQTSDVTVKSRAMRKLVLAHSLVSFLFTTAVIALTVNLGAQLVH